MSSNSYQVPAVPKIVDSNYEVPKPPKKDAVLERSNRGAKKRSCNWSLSLLLCAGVVVAGASLALAVWSVLEVRRVSSSGLNSV